jgi:Zn-dependent peptidase ImmA (M78 family)
MKLELAPVVLRWARERAGMDRRALAGALKVPDEQVAEWEETGGLTFGMVQKLARATRTPEGQLFLGQPPQERLPVPDFRTPSGKAAATASPELLDTLYDATRKQDWYRDYVLSHGGEPLRFVGSLSLSMRPEEAAASAKQSLDLDTKLRAGASSWEEALRLQIAHLEECGILILRNGVVGSNGKRALSTEEFRGFALSDPYAPLIFLNNKDSLGAQMFTLFHELIHIGLDQSGISNPFETGETNHEVERFCNRAAAELLMPASEVREMIAASGAIDPGTLARKFRVSTFVALIRLRELGRLDKASFRALYEAEKEASARREHRASGGGNFYATELVRVGKSLARAVVESALEGRTSYRDACRLLGVSNAATVNEMAKRLDLVR